MEHTTTDKEQSLINAEKFPFGEVAWDWPQQPFTSSTKALSDERLLQEVGQASLSSVELGVEATEALENVKVSNIASSFTLDIIGNFFAYCFPDSKC